MSIIKRCAVCRRRFTVGINGVWHQGRDMCDTCAGVTRTPDGACWLPGEDPETTPVRDATPEELKAWGYEVDDFGGTK